MGFAEDQAAIAADFQRRGLANPFAPAAPSPASPGVLTMPETTISTPPALQMPPTEIVGKLGKGQLPPDDPELRALAYPDATIKPAQGLTRDGLALANAGFNALPQGVGAPLPPPPGADAAATAPAPAAPPADPNGVVPPATYVPAHFDESRIPTTPETRNDILSTYDAQEDAQKNLALSQALQSRVTADQMASEAERANQSLANQQAKEADRQQVVKSHLAKLDQLSDASLTAKIDPHQWWDSRSTFQNVMAGISIALGGGLATQNGGHNPGLDMINSAIQQNIDAQKTNLQLKQLGIQNAGNMLGAYREAFGDERLGDLAFETAQRQNAIEAMKADAMKSQAPQIQEAAANGIAQLQRQQLLTKAQFEQLAYVRAHMTGGPAAMQKVDPALLVKLPNGEQVRAPTDEEAKALRAKAGMLQNIKDNLNRIIAVRKDASPFDLKNPMSNAHRTINQLVNDTKINAAMFNAAGKKMNESDVNAMMNEIESATDLTGNPDAVLSGVRDNFDQHFTNEVRALGSEQVQRGYTVNPQGQLEPAARYVGKSDTPRTGGLAPSSFKPVGQ